MKKTMIALASVVALAACNTAGESNEGVEDVLTESNEAMAALNSYEMVTNIAIQEQEGNEVVSNVKLIRDPLAFSVKETSPNPLTGENEESHTFFMDGQQYYEEPFIGEWVQSDAEEANVDDEAELRPAEQQVDYLLEHIDLLTIEETDDSYIISSEGLEDNRSELALLLASGGNELDFDFEVTEFNYELTIDKDTMHQTNVEMSIGLDLAEEGLQSIQEMSTTYSQFDQLEQVDVNEEAIDAAISMEEATERAEEQQAELEEQQAEMEEEQNEED
ncbi:hypothetical protein JCM19046_2041 [Bacillus sp. JCM 19046]|nr:hypothetical protein JCM19045_4102 [Bacillus sp. JCM 19045]GAF17524.1 hypothetical protein JCM19046_2041 [Bacillus sp. JCM 19046]